MPPRKTVTTEETVEETVQNADVFMKLWSTDVSEQVEKKNTGKAELSYLSWAWAWKYVRQLYPDATYEVIKNENGLPYFVDPEVGIMVYTKVTIGEETHEMWLPVMDGANNAMKLQPYEIKTKWGSKPVDAATMFDINKTVMRCLTKNLAMFGLGLRLFAGEDVWGEDERSSEAKSSEPSPEDFKAITDRIQKGITKLTANMDKDGKDKFLQDVVVKHIGAVNYMTCKDMSKLNALLEDLLARAKKSA